MAVSPETFSPKPTTFKTTATSSPGKTRTLPMRQNSVEGSTGNSNNHSNNNTSTTAIDSETGASLNQQIASKYVKDRKVGEGTYATVFLGHLKSNPSEKVAIKKIKIVTEYRDGISVSAIREIKFLQELSHGNIIAMHDVYASKSQNLCLVLEFLPLGDLEMLIKDTSGIRYGTADIKAWMGMLGRGIWWCHENFVLHRDIKPNNLLIASDGQVKLADFGLARSFADPHARMTWNVITRWYRPPELLYRARHYAGAVDMWSVGCVFAELILRIPFLAGSSDVDQLDKICAAIGTPTETNWPGVTELQDYVRSDPVRPLVKREVFLNLFGTAGPDGVDLLMSTLVLDPRKRVTAKAFLEHPWWTKEPRPTRTLDLPRKRDGNRKTEEKLGEDLKRRGGELDGGATAEKGAKDKVARRLDFGKR